MNIKQLNGEVDNLQLIADDLHRAWKRKCDEAQAIWSEYGKVCLKLQYAKKAVEEAVMREQIRQELQEELIGESVVKVPGKE